MLVDWRGSALIKESFPIGTKFENQIGSDLGPRNPEVI